MTSHGVNWVLTGSLAFALQGVSLIPNDIDVQTDAAGATAASRLFASFIVRPLTFTESEYTRSYFGALQIDGVTVEIMGDLQKRLPDGTWEPPAPLQQLKRFIDVGEMRIPVLPLAYEAAAYERLGRLEKAALLRKWADELVDKQA